jgi:hypothetical protein
MQHFAAVAGNTVMQQSCHASLNYYGFATGNVSVMHLMAHHNAASAYIPVWAGSIPTPRYPAFRLNFPAPIPTLAPIPIPAPAPFLVIIL